MICNFSSAHFPAMTASILDGKTLSESIIEEVGRKVAERKRRGEREPALAVILAGEDPASAIYVRNKRLACERAGIRSISLDRPTSTAQDEVLALIDALNDDPEVDGILVQLPLPAHIDPETIIERIRVDKDVDGFHPCNIGRLAVRMLTLRSCTPAGVMTLLKSTGQDLRGRHAVVIGASNHVGRPMALELLLAGCTVSICHSLTRDLGHFVRQAEILVSAVGKPGLVRGEWIQEGAVVVDVGINRLPDGRICGDVEFDAASERAAWITPVPGGVGPMTVATLLQNTLQAAQSHDPGA
jgi:methylenetetrahydrofolate dehydrogenase (NADP+) / methenyltetrahydrofolate cyclohydrolase